jgi:hypothetical protein
MRIILLIVYAFLFAAKHPPDEIMESQDVFGLIVMLAFIEIISAVHGYLNKPSEGARS